jgi:hypothetical protein
MSLTLALCSPFLTIFNDEEGVEIIESILEKAETGLCLRQLLN